MPANTSEMERQKLELAAKMHALHVAHRIASDKRFTSREIEQPEVLRDFVDSEIRKQIGGGGTGPAKPAGIICKILAHLVKALADLGAWGAVRAISGYAIEIGCWKGV